MNDHFDAWRPSHRVGILPIPTPKTDTSAHVIPPAEKPMEESLKGYSLTDLRILIGEGRKYSESLGFPEHIKEKGLELAAAAHKEFTLRVETLMGLQVTCGCVPTVVVEGVKSSTQIDTPTAVPTVTVSINPMVQQAGSASCTAS